MLWLVYNIECLSLWDEEGIKKEHQQKEWSKKSSEKIGKDPFFSAGRRLQPNKLDSVCICVVVDVADEQL